MRRPWARAPGRADRRQGLSQPRRPEGARRRPGQPGSPSPSPRRCSAGAAISRPGGRCTTGAAALGGRQGGSHAARRAGRAQLRADPRPRRPAPHLAARPGERPEALPGPCRRLQPRPGDAPMDRCWHAEATGRPRRPAALAARSRPRALGDPHPAPARAHFRNGLARRTFRGQAKVLPQEPLLTPEPGREAPGSAFCSRCHRLRRSTPSRFTTSYDRYLQCQVGFLVLGRTDLGLSPVLALTPERRGSRQAR